MKTDINSTINSLLNLLLRSKTVVGPNYVEVYICIQVLFCWPYINDIMWLLTFNFCYDPLTTCTTVRLMVIKLNKTYLPIRFSNFKGTLPKGIHL